MNIKTTDLVLEIGSGNNPHPRSNILCDRYIHDNSQRAGGFSIVIDRPFVVADGYRLPFKDKVFDYVICSHILEHLEDPHTFIAEVARVGRAGYIEVPSSISERLFGWDFHRWFCSIRNGILVLVRKEEGERFGGFFHQLIEKNIWFRRFFEENQRKFYTSYEWKKTISLTVANGKATLAYRKKLDEEIDNLLREIHWSPWDSLTFYLQWMRRRVVRKMKKTWRRCSWLLKKRLHESALRDALLPLLACPRCQSTVALGNSRNYVSCRFCKERYPIDGVIPIMLVREERKRGY